MLPTPTRSVFLLGPRGTGKSTWIRDRFPDTVTWCLGVYLGQRTALWDDVQVLPLVDFPRRLWAGEIIRVP